MGTTSSRSSTTQVSRWKQDERERLVVEMEELLGTGLKEGDQEVLDSRFVTPLLLIEDNPRETVYIGPC